ncbi:hypothetical protein G6F63_013241 [Rhizopus arrhizus]|nr:hypothetical protein G6F63_013241 [Rhizopus arrhizus]
MLGELQRVAGKIEQDLAQAQAISKQPGLQRRIEFDPQMQAPAGRNRHQQLLHCPQHRRQIGRPQLQWRRLQALAVQHIVEDLPQHPRRIAHRGKHLLLARIQVAVGQPIQHPQQGAHRRTDLVAHRRQEVGLGQRHLLGLASGLCQRKGARLHFADIHPVTTPLDDAATTRQRSSMRMHPTPALRRLRPEDDIDRLARQRGRIDRFREPRMIVGVDRGQQTPMIDQRGLDADSEQRIFEVTSCSRWAATRRRSLSRCTRQ